MLEPRLDVVDEDMFKLWIEEAKKPMIQKIVKNIMMEELLNA